MKMPKLVLGVTAAFLSSIVNAQVNDFSNNRNNYGDFSVLVLGSGAAVARPDASGRAQASYIIFIDGEPKILMDAGAGSYQRIAEAGINLKDLELVLLTHLHADHTGDLTPIVQSLYFENSEPVTPGIPREIPITVYGPSSNDEVVGDTNVPLFPTIGEYLDSQWDRETGLDRHVHEINAVLNSGDFSYNAVEVDADISLPERVIYDQDGLKISAIGVIHTSAPSLAYSVEYNGKKLTYSGDLQSITNNLATLAQDSDLLIYDASVPNNQANPFHTTPGRIGEISAMANANNLLLTHFTIGSEGVQQQTQMKRLIRDAGYVGPIRIARDLLLVNLQALSKPNNSGL